MIAEERKKDGFEGEEISKEEQKQIASSFSHCDDNITISEQLRIYPEEDPPKKLKNNLFFRATIALIIALIVAGTVRFIWGLFESNSTTTEPMATNVSNSQLQEKIEQNLALYEQEKENLDRQYQKKTPEEEPRQPTPEQKPKELLEPAQEPAKEPAQEPAQELAPKKTEISVPQLTVGQLPLSSSVRARAGSSYHSQRFNNNIKASVTSASKSTTTVKNPSIALLTGAARTNKYLIRGGEKISGKIIAPVHYIESLGGTNLVIEISDDLHDKEKRLVLRIGSRLSLKVIINDRRVYVTEVYSLEEEEPVLLKTRVTLTREQNDRPITATVLSNREASLFLNRLLTTALETGNAIIGANNRGSSSGLDNYNNYNSDPIGTGLSTLSRSLLNRSRNSEARLNRQSLESKKIYLIEQDTKINIYFLDSFSIEKLDY